MNQEKTKEKEDSNKVEVKKEEPKEDEKEIRLSLIIENSEEYSSNSLAISIQQQSELSMQKGLSDEKKLEIMKSILLEGDGGEEDELQKQIILSKRTSLDSVGLPTKKDKPSSEQKEQSNEENNDLLPSLNEIKEEVHDENNEKEKQKEDEKEKEKENIFESKPSASIPKKVKEMRRIKTDGYLPTFGGDGKAMEERKNRLAKRLNKAKELNKKREEDNKYTKSIDITMKANLLEQKMNDKNEDNKDN